MNMNVKTGASGNGDDEDEDDEAEAEAADMEGTHKCIVSYFSLHSISVFVSRITGLCVSEYEESGLLETDDVRKYTRRNYSKLCF